MRELNVVISGFDHYDGVEVNPAVEVPKAIAEQGLGVSSAPDDPLEQVAVTVHAVSIPVSFAKAWPTLKETIEATKPNIVIATGLKHAARGVMLERCATNWADSSASLRSFRRIPASMVYHSTSRSPLAVMWYAKPCATISSPPAPTSSSPSTLCATPE